MLKMFIASALAVAALVVVAAAPAGPPADVQRLQKQVNRLAKEVSAARRDNAELKKQIAAKPTFDEIMEAVSASLASSYARASDLAGYAKASDLDSLRTYTGTTLTGRVATLERNHLRLSDFVLCSWKREADAFDLTWDVIGILEGRDIFNSNVSVAGGGRSDEGACARLGSPNTLTR